MGLPIMHDKWMRVAAALPLLIVFALAGTTLERNAVWRNDASLWGDVVRRFSRDTRAYNNLGQAYAREKNFSQAFGLYRQALELDPTNYRAHINLGNLYYNVGMTAMALAEYAEAIHINPGYGGSYYERGNINARMGRADEALADYQRGCELGYETACVSLEEILRKNRRAPETDEKIPL